MIERTATHIVSKDSPNHWSALVGRGKIASKPPMPPQVTQEDWVQTVAVDDYPYQGHPMSYWVAGALEADPDLFVMIDEFSAGHEADVAAFAFDMEGWPHLDGRWGVYLVNGPNVNYANLNPGIDACMRRRATFGCEFYYESRLDEYIETLNIFGEYAADAEARAHFVGPGRFNWLAQRSLHVFGAVLPMFPMFGITDKFARRPGVAPATWLEREIWNFRMAGYGSLMIRNGFGTWVADSDRVSSSSLDTALANAWQKYVVGGSTKEPPGV